MKVILIFGMLLAMLALSACTPTSDIKDSSNNETSANSNLSVYENKSVIEPTSAKIPPEEPLEFISRYYEEKGLIINSIDDDIRRVSVSINHSMDYFKKSKELRLKYLNNIKRMAQEAILFYDLRCKEVYTEEDCGSAIDTLREPINRTFNRRITPIDKGLINGTDNETYLWFFIEETTFQEYGAERNFTYILSLQNNSWKIVDSAENNTLFSVSYPLDNLSRNIEQQTQIIKNYFRFVTDDLKIKIDDDCNYIYKIDQIEDKLKFDSEAVSCYETHYNRNAVEQKDALICSDISLAYYDVRCAAKVAIATNFEDTCVLIRNYNYTPLGYLGQKSSWDMCYLLLYNYYRARVNDPDGWEIKKDDFCEKIVDTELRDECLEYSPFFG